MKAVDLSGSWLFPDIWNYAWSMLGTCISEEPHGNQKLDRLFDEKELNIKC